MTSNLKQIAAAIFTPIAVLIFALGVSALTNWMDSFLAGKFIMLMILLACLVFIGRMAWVMFEREDVDEA